MRTVVTGGAGFIGSHLAERLSAEGNEILVIDNLSSGSSRTELLKSLDIPVEVAGIGDEKVSGIIDRFAPQAIFHLAAQIDPRRSVIDPIHDANVNVIGTLRILEAAKQVKARVVFTSSGGTIYGEPDESEIPISEEVAGRPKSPYGISKRVSEDYLRFYQQTHGLAFVSLAPANVYGPRQDPFGEAGVVAIFTQRLLAGDECVIFGDGKQTRDFVYVADVVDAFIAALEKGEGETFNIGTGIETSVLELYDRLCGICGSNRPPRHDPEKPGEVRRSALSGAKAKAGLDWAPATSLEEGLRRTVESLQT